MLRFHSIAMLKNTFAGIRRGSAKSSEGRLYRERLKRTDPIAYAIFKDRQKEACRRYRQKRRMMERGRMQLGQHPHHYGTAPAARSDQEYQETALPEFNSSCQFIPVCQFKIYIYCMVYVAITKYCVYTFRYIFFAHIFLYV